MDLIFVNCEQGKFYCHCCLENEVNAYVKVGKAKYGLCEGCDKAFMFALEKIGECQDNEMEG